MPNYNIPADERNLTPAEVASLDRRRRRGQLFLVIGFQTFIIGMVVTLWSGQDATYSPGLAHPMLYWNIILFALSATFLLSGLRLRRGFHSFTSY